MNQRLPDWALYRSFLAILRCGSLSEAARTLGVAHPTIRRHLDDLERLLGTTLFTRSSTGLLPTEMAMQLREPAEAMESAANAFVRVASSDKGKVAGTVRISASEIMAIEVLPPILADLRRRHPGLAVELKASNVADNVLRRDVDIAVRMTRPMHKDLLARKIGEVAIGLFAHTDWLTAHSAPKSLGDAIEQRQLIGYDRDPAMLRGLSARGIAADRQAFSFRADSDLAQLAAVRAGVGVGLCQIPLSMRDPGLRRVLPRFKTSLEVWLVAHPNLREAARVRTVLDALASGLRAYLHSGTPAHAAPSRRV